MSNLHTLDLTDNQLVDVSAIAALTHLTEVTLDNNIIAHIKFMSALTELQCLSLRNNQVADLEEIKALYVLPKLHKINVANNPVASEPHFYSTCIVYLHHLVYLNDEKVRNGEELADLDRFIDSLPIGNKQAIEVKPRPWLPPEAYEIIELPGFDSICGELEAALRESIQDYIGKVVE